MSGDGASGDRDAQTSARAARARRLVALVLALALAAAGAAYLVTTRDAARPGAPATAPSAGEAADVAVEPPAPKPLPDGALGPILTEPDPDRIPFCDARNWPRVGEVVRSVVTPAHTGGDAGVMIVDEAAWAALGQGARGGVASWASKCRLGGGAVAVRGADTGVALGRYEASTGMRPADEAPR